MGVILDSSVLIAGERRSRSVAQILEQVETTQREIEIGISVVTVAELVHGAYRGRTREHQEQRVAPAFAGSAGVPPLGCLDRVLAKK